MTYLVLLLIMLLLANLPWLTDRLFFVYPLVSLPKSIAYSLLEMTIYFAVFMALAFYAELNIFGGLAPQGWEFYTIMTCLFLVAAFPGFVYRRFWC